MPERRSEESSPKRPNHPRWRLLNRYSARSVERGVDNSTNLGSSIADEQERFIVESIKNLRDMEVREVMTPRMDIVALTIPVHADDIAQAVRESGHSCFPVIHANLDDLVGILFVNDLFRSGPRDLFKQSMPTKASPNNTKNSKQGAGGIGSSGPQPKEVKPSVATTSARPYDRSTLDISRRVRKPYVLPESLGVLEALAEMRNQHRAFAVVVDEYGGVAGVLTVKDLLEPLVGDLYDEFDGDADSPIVRVDANRWLVDGRTNVDDIRDQLSIDLPEGEYVTVGGYLFEAFGHIPEEGEDLNFKSWNFRVVEMEKRRVAKVVVSILESVADSLSDADSHIDPFVPKENH